MAHATITQAMATPHPVRAVALYIADAVLLSFGTPDESYVPYKTSIAIAAARSHPIRFNICNKR